MVLAELWRRRQYEKDFQRGFEEGYRLGIAEERARRHYVDKVRAWAEARGIPADELPEFCRLPEFDEQPPDR